MPVQLLAAVARVILWVATNPYGRTAAVERITRVAVNTTGGIVRNWPRSAVTEEFQTQRHHLQVVKDCLKHAHSKTRLSQIANNLRRRLLFRGSVSELDSQEQQALRSRIRRRVVVFATLVQLAIASLWPFEDTWIYDDVPLPYAGDVESNSLGSGDVVDVVRNTYPPSEPYKNPIEAAWADLKRTMKTNTPKHGRLGSHLAWLDQFKRVLVAEWSETP